MNDLAQARQLVDHAWQRLAHWDRNMAAAQLLLEQVRASHPHDAQVLTCLGAVLCDRALYREAGVVLREALALFGAAAKLQPSAATWAACFDPHGT